MSGIRSQRELVYNKYCGRCAYCGCDISIRQMQIDHIFPKAKSHWLDSPRMMECCPQMLNKDINCLENLNPACRACNNRKHSLLLEDFRGEIAMQIERLHKYSPQYRMALRYGLISENRKPVVFYFETLTPDGV